MARMTKQFLTATIRPKDYETSPVSAKVELMPEGEHPELNWTYLCLDAGYSIGKQYVYLGRDETIALTVELLRSVRSDQELVRILSEALRRERRKPPVHVTLLNEI